MAPFVTPDAFFDGVARDHWLARPGVWRTPFAQPYASEADVFAALVALRVRFEHGDDLPAPRVFSGDRPIGFSFERHLPTPDDLDLEGFETRLRSERKGSDTGMVLGDAASLTPFLWHRACQFLKALYARVGMVSGGAHAEVFFGDYEKSFFGVHKDRLETFTFVIRGRKRFLAWPMEALAEEAGLSPEATLHALNFDALDLEPHRAQAIVLEGGPGDVMFWPASYWHVAEQAEPGFVTTLTLALAPSTMLAAGSPLRLAAEGFDEAGRDGYYTVEPNLPVPGDMNSARRGVDLCEEALWRTLEDPRFIRARRNAALQWISAMGFKRGPERLEIPKLIPDDRLEVMSPVLYEDVGEDSLMCATNGMLLESLPSFLPLVEAINAAPGRSFTVAELLATHAGGEGQPSPEELVEALAHLVASHALVPVSKAPWER
jgi:50S ribosomal protein L16 3-hydroxylase